MRHWTWCLAFLVAAAAAGPASADVVTITLDTGNPGISAYTGPYGTVSVDLTSSTIAKIKLTSNTVGGNIYLFGSGETIALNVNATTFSASNIVASNAGTGFSSPVPFTLGSGNADGLGKYSLTIKSFDGFTHSSDTLTLTLTNSSGAWASAADVLTANASGYLVAAHVFVTPNPADTSNGALATGYAAGDSIDDPWLTPAPSSLVLMGIGGLGIGGFFWRRSRRTRVIAAARQAA